MSPQLVAGVDSSTQSTKVLVCDAETGAVIRQGRAAHPDATSVDPQRWWDAWQQATSDGLLEGVEALAVGGQQHGMVALDGDGAVLHEALLWNDIRSAPEASDLMDEFGGAAAWVAAVGIIPVAAITVTKLRWLARHEPGIAAKLTDVVLPHDWLTGRILAGGAARPQQWTTDRGDASGTGYYAGCLTCSVRAKGPGVRRMACWSGRVPVTTWQRRSGWGWDRVMSWSVWAPAAQCSRGPNSRCRTCAGRCKVSQTRPVGTCR